MKSGKILLTTVLVLIAAIVFGSCSNDDSDRKPSASVALLGIWHLRSVDGTVVSGNDARRSYFFRTDTENPSNFSGTGDFYQYFAATDSEQVFPINWEINDAGQLVITGSLGAGVFEFGITSTQTYMQLEMTDVSSGTTYMYMK